MTLRATPAPSVTSPLVATGLGILLIAYAAAIIVVPSGRKAVEDET